MTTYVVAPTPFIVTLRKPVMALVLSDAPPVTVTTLSITGTVKDVNGTVVVGATVLLMRSSDNRYCQTTTTNGSGVYTFARRSDDTDSYYTVAYSLVGGITQIHGVSNRDLVPA